jgi:hypothetical protein
MISYTYNDFVNNTTYFRPGTVERMRCYMLCKESGWFPEIIFVFGGKDSTIIIADMIQWCKENCKGKWAFENWYIKFETSNDGMLFKMRWG